MNFQEFGQLLGGEFAPIAVVCELRLTCKEPCPVASVQFAQDTAVDTFRVFFEYDSRIKAGERLPRTVLSPFGVV